METNIASCKRCQYLILTRDSFDTDFSELIGQELEEGYPPAWWRVDLGALYDVYQVVIINRDTNQGSLDKVLLY